MHTTFDSFVAALNVNGNQRIGRLQSSIMDPQILAEALRKEVKSEGRDRRVPTATGYQKLLDEEDSKGPCDDTQDLDIDLLPGETRALPYQSGKPQKAAHVFGQVDSARGPFEEGDSQKDNKDEGFARKRRRVAGLPVTQRSVTVTHRPP